jgi:hypothetical protein
LTTPKIKDLVNKPINNYNNIYKTINSSSSASNDMDKNVMKTELKQYFKTLNKSSTNSDTFENKTVINSNNNKMKNITAYPKPVNDMATSILESGDSLIGGNNYSAF